MKEYVPESAELEWICLFFDGACKSVLADSSRYLRLVISR